MEICLVVSSFSLSPIYLLPFCLHDRVGSIWKLTFLVRISRLLEPVGLWRSQARCSRGRRWKKIERRKARLATTQPADRSHPRPKAGLSSRPVVVSYLALGANSTTRTLGYLACESTPGTFQQDAREKLSSPNPLLRSSTASTLESLAAIFVCRTTQPAPFHANLPILVAMASDAQPQKPPIRLVSLPQTAAARLSKALHLPRVGIIGIADDCPQAAALIAHVRQHVPPLSMSK